ncbi:MAG: hypothetical protein FJW30_20350 [Acidobacteria bacterium]|nr:hypothetical protein [Acidobacteriota bacterium]
MPNLGPFVLLLSAAAYGAPITTPNVQTLTGPVDLRFGALTSDSTLYLVSERTAYSVPSDITLDALATGVTYSTFWPGLTSTIFAGARVDVWLVHSQRTSNTLGNLSATIDFGATILGVSGRAICGLGGACPSDTDAHGDPANQYSGLSVLRGLELLISQDSIQQLSPTALALTLRTSRFFMDEIRVFTLSQPDTVEAPEPPGLGYAAAGLLLLYLRRRTL